MSVRFVVDYSARVVKCKRCPVSIEKGQLRIGRGTGHTRQLVFYHPACIFQTFANPRKNIKSLQSLDDLEGINTLEDADKQILNQLLIQSLRANQTASSAPLTAVPSHTAAGPSRQPVGAAAAAAAAASSTAAVVASSTASAINYDALGAAGSNTTATVAATSAACTAATATSVAAASTSAATAGAASTTVQNSHTPSVIQSITAAAQFVRQAAAATLQLSHEAGQAVVAATVGSAASIRPTVISVGPSVNGQPLSPTPKRMKGGDLAPGSDDVIYISSEDDDDEDNPTPNAGPTGAAPVDVTTAVAGGLSPLNIPQPTAFSSQPVMAMKTDRQGGVDEECCICLDNPVHPVSLPCNHTFCYLCAKGLALSSPFGSPLCSLCRRPFPRDYLDSAQVLRTASQDMNDTPPLEATEDEWQWFYQGNKGWWRFEARTNDEIEECFSQGDDKLETLICGKLYTIDFNTMDQYQTSYPNKKRRIKRDKRSSQCKGVAGLGKRSWNQANISS